MVCDFSLRVEFQIRKLQQKAAIKHGTVVNAYFTACSLSVFAEIPRVAPIGTPRAGSIEVSMKGVGDFYVPGKVSKST